MKTEKLREEFYKSGRFKNLPVYDLHGHMGNWVGIHFPCAYVDDMVEKMDRSGVKMLVFSHHAALFSPDTGNRLSIEAVKKYPQRLRAYCGINPNYPEIIKKDLSSFDKYYKSIYVGFKFLSDYHGYPVTDARYEPAWEMADSKGLLVLLHTWGGSLMDGAIPIRKVAEKYHNVKILLGHSCHGEWNKAIDLVRDFPNVYLEMCAVLDERGVMEKMVEQLGSDRLIFGTDFPWFSYNYYIGAVLGADITDEDRTKILYSNGANLLSPHLSDS